MRSFLFSLAVLSSAFFAAPSPAGAQRSLFLQGWGIKDPVGHRLAVITLENSIFEKDLALRVPGLEKRFPWREFLPVEALEAVRAGCGGLLIDMEGAKKTGKEGWTPSPPVLVRTYWVPRGRDSFSLARTIIEEEKQVFRSKASAMGKGRSASFEESMEFPVSRVRTLGLDVFLSGEGGGEKEKYLFAREFFACAGDRVIELSCARVPGKKDPFRRDGVWDRTRDAFVWYFQEAEDEILFLGMSWKFYLGILLGGILGLLPFLWLDKRKKLRAWEDSWRARKRERRAGKRGRPGPSAGILALLGPFLLLFPPARPSGGRAPVRFGPARLTLPEGFSEAEPGPKEEVLTPWEALEVERKRMRVFYDPRRKAKIGIWLVFEGIGLPPLSSKEGYSFGETLNHAFCDLYSNREEARGWSTSFCGSAEGGGIDDLHGGIFSLSFRKEKETKGIYGVFSEMGEKSFLLIGEGGTGFEDVWKSFVKKVTVDKPEKEKGISLPSPVEGLLAGFILGLLFWWRLYSRRWKGLREAGGPVP